MFNARLQAFERQALLLIPGWVIWPDLTSTACSLPKHSPGRLLLEAAIRVDWDEICYADIYVRKAELEALTHFIQINEQPFVTPSVGSANKPGSKPVAQENVSASWT